MVLFDKKKGERQMSTLRLEYEILVSGIYPFTGKLEKCGFTMTKNIVDENLFNSLAKESIIYLSPFLGICQYPDENGTPVYLTFRKEEFVEIDYRNVKEYDVGFTNKFLEKLNLFELIENLEKTMILEVNNDIKFPAKVVKVYDLDGNFVTMFADFMRLNVPCLISNDSTKVLEAMKRQNNRLNFGVTYDKVIELSNNNKCFKNALSMYHSSFDVSDHQVGFTLLVIALESLLGLSTYEKVERCEMCNQDKHKVTTTISQNVSLILMDKDDTIKDRMKKLYNVRSRFVHDGKEVLKQEEQEIQEYVRKVLLMYWFVSMNKSTYEHTKIITEMQSIQYRDNMLYKCFLTGLDNTSFKEKHDKMLSDISENIRDIYIRGQNSAPQ